MSIRYILSEASQALARGKFGTGDSVTITIYRNAGASAESLTSNVCLEQDSTGYFLFPMSNLTTAPTSFSNYFFIMTNGTPVEDQTGELTFGGYPDTIDANVGANVVTITIEETDTTAIVGAQVQLFNAAQTVVLDTKTTNSSGIVVFSADNGSYKIVIHKPQTSFTVPEDLTVSGTTAQTYNGTPIVITPAVGAGECIVSIFSSAQDPSTFLTSLAGTATIKQLPTLISGEYFPNSKIAGTYDSITGRLSWTLPRGSVIFFKVDVLGIGQEKTIPDSASANYEDL